MTDLFSKKSLSGKTGVSMDMAVTEHNRSSETEGHFVLFDGVQNDSFDDVLVIDTAALDIDNDGVYEDCSMTYGPTSGLFTVVITAYADGKIKYKNTFNLACGNILFAEKDGSAQLVRDGEYHKLYVNENRIVIDGLDPQYEGYWGDSEWNYDLR